MNTMSISLAMCAVDFSSTSMSPEDQAIAESIAELKKELGDDLLILGHHYQRDSIVKFLFALQCVAGAGRAP